MNSDDVRCPGCEGRARREQIFLRIKDGVQERILPVVCREDCKVRTKGGYGKPYKRQLRSFLVLGEERPYVSSQ